LAFVAAATAKAYLRPMRRAVLAIVIVLAASGGAAAYCPSFPDNASTQYVQNQEELMLCHQRELAAAVEAQQRQVEIKAAIESQMRLLEMQRRMMDSLNRRQF
jgi:hypothetical protein